MFFSYPRNKRLIFIIFIIISIGLLFIKSELLLAQKARKALLRHVEYLSELGNRLAGSEGDMQAAQYISEQMSDYELQVKKENFHFSIYNPLSVSLRLAEERKIGLDVISWDPFMNGNQIEGSILCVSSATASSAEEISKLQVSGNIVVINPLGDKEFNLGMLNRALLLINTNMPKAVAVVAASDQEAVKDLVGQSVIEGVIELESERKEYNSCNIIGLLPGKSASLEDIIISAHYDSDIYPGSNDNASGVAVMLEIAKHFSSKKNKPNKSLVFCAWGAEESGFVGSRIYVSRHSAHLKNLCQAVINIDSVGGGGEIFVEMEGGVENISPIKGSLSIPFHIVDKALHNRILHSDILWILPQLILASNVDESFKGTINKAVELSGYTVMPARYQGSDHLVFARAGVPATNFATSEGYTHSEEDNLTNIKVENMEKVMNIIIKLVELLDKE